MRILIIEDDAEQCELLSALFTKMSKEKLDIFSASTLERGIVLSFHLQPDVTYLDLNLPDSQDWRATIRAIPRIFPPVIVITAMDDPIGEIELEAYTFGAQNFFQKPKDLKLLVPHLLSTGAAAHLRRVMPAKRSSEEHGS